MALPPVNPTPRRSALPFFTQGLSIIVLGIATTVGYALLVFGLALAGNTILGTTIFAPAANHPLLIGGLAFVLALMLNPAHRWLKRRFDLALERNPQVYRERAQTFARLLTTTVDLQSVLQTLNDTLNDTIAPEQSHLFLLDPEHKRYDTLLRPGNTRTTDIEFLEDSHLVKLLSEDTRPLYLPPDTPLPAVLTPDSSLLAVLGAVVFAPILSQNRLVGWLALGPQRGNRLYDDHDLSFIETLADQVSLAIERAQVVSDLEQRVSELNVINELSQASNINVARDALFDLIFVQASRVLPTANFYIALSDTNGTTVRYAYFVESGERVPAQENRPWEIGLGLSSAVLRSGQAINADNYLKACAEYQVMPRRPASTAWLGVPLNADQGRLGLMCIFSTTPGQRFTSAQVRTFTALADHSAAAIAKTELYQQTARRARQLATLNEVSKVLTSTLELRPLLNIILNSAVTLLESEAGSLFLTDESTGELVFELVVGPIDDRELIGMRIPAGRGIVGAAASSGQTVLVNDVSKDTRFFSQVDRTSGFVTRNLIATPLRVSDRTVGVIEIINKRSHQPFNLEDEDLLVSFGSQAAVAIENARLFSQTDQALEARVQELSQMQRIVRQLNAELDIQRVLDITVDTALQTTGADAGLAAMLEDDGLHVAIHRGYETAEIDPWLKQPLPTHTGLLRKTIDGRTAHLETDVINNADYQVIRPQTAEILLVPIQREGRVLAVVILESTQPGQFNTEMLDFLNRLSDNSAIAVANAVLLRVVNSANQAKSELVGDVAHELKNPMTSIKGNTNLLVNGFAGPISDMQKELLQVVARNVVRMENLVLDLTEVTRIETGQMRLELEIFNFTEVISEAMPTLQVQIETKGQQLNQHLADDLPPVYGDRRRLTQILINLLSNAHKYSPENRQIDLHVRPAENVWDPNGAAEVLHISVTDQGIGILPVDKPKIFSKFFRAKDKASEDVPGTGLGLNIVKTLVEMQGGQVWFDSIYERGSTFHFTVPLARTMQPQPEAEIVDAPV